MKNRDTQNDCTSRLAVLKGMPAPGLRELRRRSPDLQGADFIFAVRNLNISQQSARDDLSGPRAVTSVSGRSCGIQIDQLFGHKDFLLFGEIHRHELFGRDFLPLCPLHIPRASVRITRVFVGKFSLRF
jgi:hypothetical protein